MMIMTIPKENENQVDQKIVEKISSRRNTEAWDHLERNEDDSQTGRAGEVLF